MNKLLLLPVLLFTAYYCNAQQKSTVNKKNIPEAVLKAYSTQNSAGALDTLWETEYIPIYKVKHIENERESIWEYSAKGDWIRTYTNIGIDELPLLVINQIQTSYPGYTIKTAQIELSNNGKMYAIILVKNAQEITKYFLMSGKLYR
ncbi:MAG: hypothetical protein H3C45_02140 [Bacteroidia bacterium]|nr:hypothetical protein [Bacteroidia bacterium]MCC7533621.1 hypothetical protein [Bacteroidia bacterium]